MRAFVHLFLTAMLGATIAACGHAEKISKDRPNPTRLVGNSCSSDSDCDQYCAQGREFPGGFCTLRGCRGNSDCPDGTVCITTHEGVCAYPCAGPLDCTAEFLGRSGYTCHFYPGYTSGDATAVQYEVCVGNQ